MTENVLIGRKAVERWDVFGDGYLLVVVTTQKTSWYRKLLCKILLGSKFTNLEGEK